jgi:hypothetical protein
MRFIIHIVPHLPPQNSGVGDYAVVVGRRMEEIGGITCGYVAAGVNAVELPNDGEHVRNITGRCDPGALWRAVEELAGGDEPSPGPARRGSPQASVEGRETLTVVLHYSGYGYDRNGAPAWLVDALRHRPQGRFIRVLAYFHELYANGWPWQRAFWFSARQRRVAADIARLSDALLTNREQSARWLEEQTGRLTGSVRTLPVPSNAGEPDQLPDYESRPRRAVVFGDARRRAMLLDKEARAVARLLKTLEIVELIDIGRPAAIDKKEFARAGIAIEQPGYLDAREVGRQLSQCRVGLIRYPLAFVAKSSVFAAYAAHGVVPVIWTDRCEPADDVEIGRNALAFPRLGQLVPDVKALLRMSAAIHEWYRLGRSTNHAFALQQMAEDAANVDPTFIVQQPGAETAS